MSADATPLPLEGIRVVEFSHMVMGPTCGVVLADLGAEAIKIEPPGKGDRTRYLTDMLEWLTVRGASASARPTGGDR